jgi:SAM-dependent methyltransferase
MTKRTKPAPATKKKAVEAIASNLARRTVDSGNLFQPEEGKKLVLHVGSGAYRRERLHRAFHGPEWREIRVDEDAANQPDIQAASYLLAGVPDNSVDAVWSGHQLPQLFAHQAVQAMKEFYRVLKVGGVLLVAVPDLQRAAEPVVLGNLETSLYQSPGGPITALDILYGHTASLTAGNSRVAHRTGFTGKTLGLKLRHTGFFAIEIQRIKLELLARALKLPENHPQASKDIVMKVDEQNLPDELDVPPLQWQLIPG